MTIRDTTLVFSILTAAYPYFYRDIRQDEDQMRDAISVWHEMLAEYDIVTAKVALKRLIATQKEYPPTIGQMLESINIVSGHAAPDADEIWAEITNAIHNYGYYRAIEAIDSLSEFARDTVKAFGWEALCKSENAETNRAHFLRIYQAIKTRHDHKYILPGDVRAFIEDHTSKNKSLSRQSLPAKVETGKKRLPETTKTSPHENKAFAMEKISFVLSQYRKPQNQLDTHIQTL